jgi:hypothetical protein
VVALGLVLAGGACGQPAPDEAAVAAALSRLPGVRSVDASFTSRSLGNSGDQRLVVTLVPSTPPRQVEDLVDLVRRGVDGVEHGDEFDEFALVVESERDGAGKPVWSSFTYGKDPVERGLAQRWATAVSESPPGGILLRSWADQRPVHVSLSSREHVSTSLAWALGSALADRSWSFVEYQTTGSPYARFVPDAPLAPSMVTDWSAIESTYAGEEGGDVVSRVVVVEDHDGVRHVRVSVAVPGVAGVLTPAEHGELVWPTADAAYRSRPAGHGFELSLHRDDDLRADLVDAGGGDAAWESAYRERFPAAVSAPPT